MKKIWAEFKDFLNQGDFVTIAVGLIIALQVKDVVDSIIVGVIDPILSAILGKENLSEFGFDIGDARDQHRSRPQRHHHLHRGPGPSVRGPQGVQRHEAASAGRPGRDRAQRAAGDPRQPEPWPRPVAEGSGEGPQAGRVDLPDRPAATEDEPVSERGHTAGVHAEVVERGDEHGREAAP